MQESFEKEFATLRELGSDTFVLRGASIIVEILPKEEIKIKGTNIVLSSSEDHVRKSVEANRALVGRVLMAGPGYWTEDEQYEPLEVQPGSLVLMPQHSFSTISHFPGISRPTEDKLAIIKMDAVIAYYPTEAAYNRAKEKLNS